MENQSSTETKARDLTDKIIRSVQENISEVEAEKGASKDQLYSVTDHFGTSSKPICKEQIEYLSIFGLYQIIKQALSVMIVV